MEKSIQVNGAPKTNLKTDCEGRKELFGWFEMRNDQRTLLVWPCKCDDTLKWIHKIWMQRCLEETQGGNELEKSSVPFCMKVEDTAEKEIHPSSILVNGTSKSNLKLPIVKDEKICLVCLTVEQDDQSSLQVWPCKCDGTSKWIHEACLRQWLEETQGKNELNKLSIPSSMKDKDTVKQDVNFEADLMKQVKNKIESPYSDSEIPISSNKVLNLIHYHILENLLHKASTHLNHQVEIALVVLKKEIDWESKYSEHDLPSKDFILWDFSSILKFLKLLSKEESFFSKRAVKEIERFTEQLENMKYDIDSIMNVYDEYYKEIERYLDSIGSIVGYNCLNIDREVICCDSDLESLGWAKGIHKAIFECQKFSEMIKLSFGPSKLDNEKKIKNYIKEQMFQFKDDQPEISKMISAARKQQEKFGDGTKFLIIFCAFMVKTIKFFLIRGLSPKTVKNGYKIILKQAIKVLYTLSFKLDADDFKNFVNNSGKELKTNKFLAGGGAVEIELDLNLDSFELNENENKDNEVITFDGFQLGLLEVPQTLLENNGLCNSCIIWDIKDHHMEGYKYSGCDIKGDNVFLDAKKCNIVDHFFTKQSAMKLAVRAACEIINDYDLQHLKSTTPNQGRAKIN